MKGEGKLGAGIMNLFKVKTLIRIFLIIFSIVSITKGTAKAYYGTGLGSGYYGMYGSGLYGSYGGYGSLYNSMYGLGAMYGLGGYGLMGGLYGSMYGLGGLYGSMYGLGGLYGSLYGLGGYGLMGGLYGSMYGLGGLYGSMYGLGGLMGGLYGMSSMGGLGSLAMLSLLGNSGLFGVTSPSTAVAAEQVGTWEGLWSNGVLQGPINLNIVEDPVLPNIISGFVQLITNPLLPTGISVTGEVLGTQIIVNGIVPGVTGGTIELDLSALLISSTQMEGSYTLIKNGTTLAETGTFQAVLTTSVF